MNSSDIMFQFSEHIQCFGWVEWWHPAGTKPNAVNHKSSKTWDAALPSDSNLVRTEHWKQFSKTFDVLFLELSRTIYVYYI